MHLSPIKINVFILSVFWSAAECLGNGTEDFNSVIFTQQWGFSACRKFKDENPDKSCTFGNSSSIWSIHGVWPTSGSSKGPNFCKKVKFVIDDLNPIIADLHQYWFTIDASKSGSKFWRHEWQKHGSCAMEMDQFSTELKYFSEGLQLRKKHDLYTILKNGGIVPTSAHGYQLDDILAAFKKAANELDPYVQCLQIKNKETNATEYHLLSIEICLNKSLDVISCKAKYPETYGESRKLHGDQAEPCPNAVPILYNDYAQELPPTFKFKYHRMKPFFAKNIPLSKKVWHKVRYGHL